MPGRSPKKVFSAPLHVTVGADGVAKIFLPNGASVMLSVEAAALSSALLARAVADTRKRAARKQQKGSNVVTVDFVHGARRA